VFVVKTEQGLLTERTVEALRAFRSEHGDHGH
jgi:hypothetical protein